MLSRASLPSTTRSASRPRNDSSWVAPSIMTSPCTEDTVGNPSREASAALVWIETCPPMELTPWSPSRSWTPRPANQRSPPISRIADSPRRSCSSSRDWTLRSPPTRTNDRRPATDRSPALWPTRRSPLIAVTQLIASRSSASSPSATRVTEPSIWRSQVVVHQLATMSTWSAVFTSPTSVRGARSSSSQSTRPSQSLSTRSPATSAASGRTVWSVSSHSWSAAHPSPSRSGPGVGVGSGGDPGGELGSGFEQASAQARKCGAGIDARYTRAALGSWTDRRARPRSRRGRRSGPAARGRRGPA